MNNASITSKIWLSIGIFVLGFISSTVLIQVQGLSRERALRMTSEGLFPAAQKAQDAVATFELTKRAFRDAVVMLDKSGLERAAKLGNQASKDLQAIASIRELPSERTATTKAVAARLKHFMEVALRSYGAMVL